jgi:hypothetical protein
MTDRPANVPSAKLEAELRWTPDLPLCPWCSEHVDVTGDSHRIAWVKGVLYHASCLEEREEAEADR